MSGGFRGIIIELDKPNKNCKLQFILSVHFTKIGLGVTA